MGTSAFQLIAHVKGCAETDRGMPTRSAAPEPIKPPTLEVSGSTIRYSHALTHLCCRQAEFALEIEGAIITLYEVWRGPGCRCMCYSELDACIDHIPSGTYTVHVIERGTEPNSEQPMPVKVLMTQTIAIAA